MAVPPAGTILYTFAPPTDSWTSQAIWDQGVFGNGTITDSYDFYQWAYYGGAPGGYGTTGYCYSYKSGVTNLSNVHRIKCTFSITALPYDLPFDDYPAGVIGLGYNFNALMTEFSVRGDGKLVLESGGEQSTSTIVPNTLYEVEIYLDGRNSPGTRYLYIDGELEIEEPFYGPPPAIGLLFFEAGPAYNSNGFSTHDHPPLPQSVEVTTHVQDIIWTMEVPATARWTMMAVGI